MSEATIGALGAALEAIPGADPCGSELSPTDEPDYRWLRTEAEKSTAIPPEPVDWQGLVDRSRRLLSERSKDWRVGCFLARGLYHTERLAGLAEGLQTLDALAERYWSAMFPRLPKGKRGRLGSIEWMFAGLAQDLKNARPLASDLAPLTTAGEVLARLDARLREVLDEKVVPGHLKLRNEIRRLADTVPSKKTGPSQEVDGESSPQPVETVVVEFPPPIDSPEVAQDALDRCQRAFFRVADVLQASPENEPRALRLRRMAAWLNVEDTPPVEDGRLEWPGAPESGLVEQLEEVLETDAPGVLSVVERWLADFPACLCIDLQRLAWDALGRLPGDHSASQDVVCAATLDLLQRAPDLAELLFSDGTPVASETALEWLEAHVNLRSSAAEYSGRQPSPNEDVVERAAREADEVLRESDFEASMALLHNRISTMPTSRDRFRLRLVAARHAMKAGPRELALDLLQGLDDEAGRRDLASWEPGLWVEVLTAAVELSGRGRRRKVWDDVFERLPDLSKRLARLDLAAAAKLTGGEEK